MARNKSEKKADATLRGQVKLTQTANSISRNMIKKLDVSVLLKIVADQNMTIRQKKSAVRKQVNGLSKEGTDELFKSLNILYKDQMKQLAEVAEEFTGKKIPGLTNKAIQEAFIKDMSIAATETLPASGGGTPKQMYESTWRGLSNGMVGWVEAEAMGLATAANLNGIMAKFRRDLESSIRTQTFSLIAAENDRFYKANSDIVRGIMFSAVLDGRTTNFCKSVDGTIVQLSDPMRAPFHVNCRTANIPVMEGETDSEAREALNYRSRVGPGDEYEEGSKAKDKKATKRNREKGKVEVEEGTGKKNSTSSSYGHFLSSQIGTKGGSGFIRDAMGKTRGKAFIQAVKDNPGKDPQRILTEIITAPLDELKAAA